MNMKRRLLNTCLLIGLILSLPQNTSAAVTIDPPGTVLIQDYASDAEYTYNSWYNDFYYRSNYTAKITAPEDYTLYYMSAGNGTYIYFYETETDALNHNPILYYDNYEIFSNVPVLIDGQVIPRTFFQRFGVKKDNSAINANDKLDPSLDFTWVIEEKLPTTYNLENNNSLTISLRENPVVVSPIGPLGKVGLDPGEFMTFIIDPSDTIFSNTFFEVYDRTNGVRLTRTLFGDDGEEFSFVYQNELTSTIEIDFVFFKYDMLLPDNLFRVDLFIYGEGETPWRETVTETETITTSVTETSYLTKNVTIAETTVMSTEYITETEYLRNTNDLQAPFPIFSLFTILFVAVVIKLRRSDE